MHFREQGRSLQLVRTTYDPSKRRGVQTVVTKLPLYTYTIPEAVRQLLTAEEIQQLTDYLAIVEAGRKEETQTMHLRMLKYYIATATESLNSGKKIDDADAIWSAIGDLSKALKKSGYAKTVKSRAARTAVSPTSATQGTLLND